MIRLHFVVEGQTEEAFVNQILANHLGEYHVVADVRCVATGRRGHRIYRGGVIDYSRVKRDLERWMKEDGNDDVYFTTMLDLYRLPLDFPGYATTGHVDPYQRVAALEEAFGNDLDYPRFVPHLQLHEFEAILLSDPERIGVEFIEREDAVARLARMAREFACPELIDDGPDTAPSKRIAREIPEYLHRKVSAGPRIAREIGLSRIRERCPHFHAWLAKIETLG
ncbi:MAG: DUF4276 family protein [Chloroflexota bacterium]